MTIIAPYPNVATVRTFPHRPTDSTRFARKHLARIFVGSARFSAAACVNRRYYNMRMASHLTARRIPRQERGERRVAELLDAAAWVIAETGYEAATMSAIATRAHASIGSLYQFFPNKEVITQALRIHYSRTFDELCVPLSRQSRTMNLEDLVRHLIGLTVSFIDSHPAFLALMDAPASTRTPAAIRRVIRDRFTEMLLLKKPRMSRAKAGQLASVILKILKGMNELYAESPPREKPHCIQEFKIVLLSYLKSRLGNIEDK
jgi:AcrR family transcriptional regulator